MKKRFFKVLTIIIVFAAVFCLLTGCKKKNEENNNYKAVYKIGICNFVDDASLNQIVDNIKTGLSEIETEQGVKFNILYDNCNADANVLNQIIANFISNKVDLMIGIATPVAMAMQTATEENGIPVVFAAVSDPLSTGLVDSLEKPGANLTGTSDYLDSAAVFNLMFALKPNAKKVGLLYDVGQDASTTAIAQAKEILAKRNVRIIERTGTNVDEVVLAAKALVSDKVDAVFTPTDNTIMTAELSVYEIFADAGIPHFTGADSFALNGAFLGYGVDYANLGRATARMTADILINAKNPGEVPVMTFDNGTATINVETAKALGYDFDYLFALFAPLCTKVQSITTADSF